MALLDVIRDHLDLSCITVNGRTLGENIGRRARLRRRRHPRPRQPGLRERRARRAAAASLAPRGAVLKRSAADAEAARAHRPGGRVQGPPRPDRAHRRSRPRRHGRQRPGAAGSRADRRARHAGMGHAADPEKAAEAGRARHGAHLRCAHERHQLRHLHPARLPGKPRRRAARPGARRRPDPPRH